MFYFLFLIQSPASFGNQKRPDCFTNGEDIFFISAVKTTNACMDCKYGECDVETQPAKFEAYASLYTLTRFRIQTNAYDCCVLCNRSTNSLYVCDLFLTSQCQIKLHSLVLSVSVRFMVTMLMKNRKQHIRLSSALSWTVKSGPASPNLEFEHSFASKKSEKLWTR